MHHRLYHVDAHIAPWHYLWSEVFLAFIIVVLVFVSPASAAMRFQERSLYMASSDPGVTTSYTVSFKYMSPLAVGSVDMLFCLNPIPYEPCVTPTGLNVSNAQLVSQTGETGFSIQQKSTNHIVLTRSPQIPTTNGSSYTFDNIVNPTDTTQAFSIRLKSHASLDASGPQIDFGSVRGQVTTGIMLETQVPPMLIFCVAEQVDETCATTNQTYYRDMGQLDSESTLVAQSQMAVGTNATGGFAITVNGPPLSAGTSVIASPAVATESQPGTNQFGINLVANSNPAIGQDPVLIAPHNVTIAPGYDTPDRYKFVAGDLVASSSHVSLMRKFTVSYILNSRNNLKAGVYTTTLTYIASGRF